jgi:hypothetical protein
MCVVNFGGVGFFFFVAVLWVILMWVLIDSVRKLRFGIWFLVMEMFLLK